MNTKFLLHLAALLLLLGTQSTQAAISCSISSPGFSATYTGAQSITQTNLTLNCSRLSGDPNSSAYSIRPDNGLYNSAQQNRANLSTYYLEYEDYLNSTCSTLWRPSGGGASATINGTINFGTSLTATVVRDFWGCIPASQAYAAGNYTDTVIMTLTYNDGANNTTATGTHAVLITSPPTCTITTSPGNLNFTYTAWQVSAAAANTTFGANCTILGSYSISVSPAGGVVAGLNYALLINTTSSGGSNPLGGTGTGAQQTYYINGTMPANQSGACAIGSCINSASHTLTVTF